VDDHVVDGVDDHRDGERQQRARALSLVPDSDPVLGDDDEEAEILADVPDPVGQGPRRTFEVLP